MLSNKMAGRLPASPLNLRTPMKGKPLFHCTAERKEQSCWKDRAQVHKTSWQHSPLSIMEILDFSGRNVIILYIAVFKNSATQQKCYVFWYIKVKKKFLRSYRQRAKKGKGKIQTEKLMAILRMYSFYLFQTGRQELWCITYISSHL